jgi:MtaA/CmuA family methyltransferase
MRLAVQIHGSKLRLSLASRSMPDLTSKQLLLAALRGQPVPRVPVAPLTVHFCARVGGVSLHRYTSEARTLADCVIRTYERFRPDAVCVSADTWVSAQAMGARVGPLTEDQPWGGLGEPFVQTAADLRRIPPPDPETQGRYPLMLEALQRVVSELGREVAVLACFDQYPFSLAAALMGINQIMLALDDDPAFVRALMERCAEYGLAYGRALSAAGADVLTGGDSPAGLIGPRRYREVALPFEQRLIAGLQAATNKPVSLHICGDAEPILADMARSGADGLEIDHRTDLGRACRAVGPGMALWGNLDPVGVLARGDPARVRQASRAALAAVAAAGHRRFVLSSGCALAVETPFANVDALIGVAHGARE